MKKKYSPTLSWENEFINRSLPYPDVFLTRILKGKYPQLKFNFKKNSKIVDIGFGQGRHFPLFSSVGLKIYGTEISNKLVKITLNNFKNSNIKIEEAKESFNHKINFQKNMFDILVSWNSSYYMYLTPNLNFKLHVKEFGRILKKNGFIIMSLPKRSSYIFKNSKYFKNGYRIIKNDYFKLRNGEVMRVFKNKKDIIKEFSPQFKNFSFSDVHDDCFGLNYHWHIFTAQKK
tara:strand:- start:58 stop:750 length:693 start_codon:yes stop_codon:yes gene_type:complete